MREPPSGFTFIELIIVMLMLGLLTFSLIPTDYFQTTNIDSASRRVEMDIRYAQDYARTTNTTCGVQFLANGNYTVYQTAVGTPITSPLTREAMIKDIGAEFKNTFINNTVTFEFDATGRPIFFYGGGTVNVSDGISTIGITVTSSTGVTVRN